MGLTSDRLGFAVSMDGDFLDLEELESQINQLVDKSYTEEMLKIQLSEFEMLQSMFSNPGELTLDDSSVLAHISNYLNGKTSLVPNHLDFTVHLSIDSKKLEVCVNLPTEYPNFEPDVFVRSESLNRNQQRLLNSDLGDYISSLDRGDLCVCSAIAWLQENASNYFDGEAAHITDSDDKLGQDTRDLFCRFWIYSHHIYSKSKRREILDLAREFNLTGFCLPGRPGIICVEGLSSDCEEWWLKIKCLNWKKIMCKKKEELVIDKTNIDQLRKFSDFKEILFEAKGKRKDFHMDFGEFHKYLLQHNCEYIFKDYFGLEGK